MDSEKVDEQLLAKLIEEKIILQEAKKKGTEVTDQEVDENISDSCNVTTSQPGLRKNNPGPGLNAC